MTPESRERYEEARCLLYKAHDALARAGDGVDLENWDYLELGYATAQLLRAIKHMTECVALINQETVGESEGVRKPQLCLDCGVILFRRDAASFKLDEEGEVGAVCDQCAHSRHLT